ncbi:MAG: hypothetical protein RLZZ292_660 [Bacteroidota bacterium]|jgi:hypothetical protein
MKKKYLFFFFLLGFVVNLNAQQLKKQKNDTIDVYILKIIDSTKLERYPLVAYEWCISHPPSDSLQLFQILDNGKRVEIKNYDKTALRYQIAGGYWSPQERSFSGMTLSDIVEVMTTLDYSVIVESDERKSEVLYMFRWPDETYDHDFAKLNTYIKEKLGLELIKARRPKSCVPIMYKN